MAGTIKLMASKQLAAICAAPDLGVAIEKAGVAVDYLPIDKAFPAMAQAIMASDSIIAKRPKLVRGFVAATLKAVRQIVADPAKAAKAFVAAVPQQAGNEKTAEAIMRLNDKLVYPVEKGEALGMFSPARVAAVEKFYLTHGIIQKHVSPDSVYTNAFVR
jgi:NitT/TauT family transport system substrate-binding protein